MLCLSRQPQLLALIVTLSAALFGCSGRPTGSDAFVLDIEIPIQQRLPEMRAFFGPSQFDPVIEAKNGEKYAALLDADDKLRAFKKGDIWCDAHSGEPMTALLVVKRGVFDESNVIDLVNLISGKIQSRAEVKSGTSKEDAIQAAKDNAEDRNGWLQLLKSGPFQSVAIVPERLMYSQDGNVLRITAVGRHEGAVSCTIDDDKSRKLIEDEISKAALNIKDTTKKIGDGWIANGARSIRATNGDGIGVEATIDADVKARKIKRTQ